MAIIIPSKNIYGDINNPKIIENAIKKIEYTATGVSQVNENANRLSDVVTGTSGNQTNGYIIVNTSDGSSLSDTIPTISDFRFISGVQCNAQSWSAKHTLSPRIQDDYYIRLVNPQLETTYEVKIEKGRANSYPATVPSGYERIDFTPSYTKTYNTRITTKKGLYSEFSDINFSNNTVKTDIGITISENGISGSFSSFLGASTGDKPIYTKTISLTPSHINLALDGTYFPASISTTYTNDNTLDFSIKALSKLTVYAGFALRSLDSVSGNVTVPIECLKITFSLKKAKIIYNERIQYLKIVNFNEVIENTETDGEAVFSIAQNDFLRGLMTYNGTWGDHSRLFEKTLDLYKNGKEIATLKCNIGEYYDENGNLVISAKTNDKMTFEHYDKVVPMSRSSNGKDAPISFNSDGTAKVFEVVGVNFIYDGSLLQELLLRETGESIEIPFDKI